MGLSEMNRITVCLQKEKYRAASIKSVIRLINTKHIKYQTLIFTISASSDDLWSTTANAITSNTIDTVNQFSMCLHGINRLKRMLEIPK